MTILETLSLSDLITLRNDMVTRVMALSLGKRIIPHGMDPQAFDDAIADLDDEIRRRQGAIWPGLYVKTQNVN